MLNDGNLENHKMIIEQMVKVVILLQFCVYLELWVSVLCEIVQQRLGKPYLVNVHKVGYWLNIGQDLLLLKKKPSQHRILHVYMQVPI
jgi:hypothetical protein